MSASQAAALSLFEKYNALSNQLQASRERKIALEHEAGQLETKMLTAQQESETMLRDAVRAEKEEASWHEKVEQALDHVTSLQQERDDMAREHDELQRQEEQGRRATVEQYEDFLRDSCTFRNECKQLRLRASVLGLKTASVLAMVVATGTEEDLESFPLEKSKFDKIGENVANEDEEDPETWTIPQEDEEMLEQWEIYRDRKQSCLEVKSELEAFESKVHAVRIETEGSRAKRDQLQQQLDRINEENVQLDSQIQGLEQQANAARRQIAPGAQPQRVSLADASTNSAPPAQPPSRRVPVNPYRRNITPTATSSSTTARSTNPALSNLSSARRAELRAVALGRTVASTAKNATPMTTMPTTTTNDNYGNKRSRRDRQFGSSLYIPGPERTAAIINAHAAHQDASFSYAHHEFEDVTTNTQDAETIVNPIENMLDRAMQCLEDADDEEDEVLFASASNFKSIR